MSGWYSDALVKIGTGVYDLDTDAIDIWPVRSSGGGGGPYYAPNLLTHTNLTDIPNNTDARPVAGQALDNSSYADVAGEAVLDSDPEVFVAFPAGDAVQMWVAVHQATGGLLFLADSGPGLPFTPTGVDVTAQPNAGGWAKLKNDPANP